MKEQFGVDSEINRKSGGIFDVYVDGRQIFSKWDEDRFPTENEIVDKIRAST